MCHRVYKHMGLRLVGTCMFEEGNHHDGCAERDWLGVCCNDYLCGGCTHVGELVVVTQTNTHSNADNVEVCVDILSRLE